MKRCRGFDVSDLAAAESAAADAAADAAAGACSPSSCHPLAIVPYSTVEQVRGAQRLLALVVAAVAVLVAVVVVAGLDYTDPMQPVDHIVGAAVAPIEPDVN